MIESLVCFKCGRKIEEGALFYRLELKIFSGFDGTIVESPDPERYRELLSKLENEHALSAEEDVYKELKIILCKNCKDVFIRFLGNADDSTAF